jgi:XTP/dITP diphosphohydrolase
MNVLLASRNAGKCREFQDLLPGMAFLPWPTGAPEIPEDGAFFHDNALQKALFARDWWRGRGPEIEAVLADDSGLCVDALWGGPGVLSARFAMGATPDEKNRRLLARMPPGAMRSARFVCVLAWAPMEGEPLAVDASVEGSLSLEPRGTRGFGFDPVFIPEGHGATFGELPPEVKASVSHRARAAARLLAALGLADGGKAR